MGTRHVTVWIGGRDVTPDTLGELSIAGGRGTFLDAPDAVSLSLSMEWPTVQSIPRVGEPVQVLGWLPGTPSTASRRALFAGNITDVAWEGATVSVLAVDPMRRLDGVYIGDEPWPMEYYNYRMRRIMDLGQAALSPEDAAWFGYGANLNEPWWLVDWGRRRMPRRDVDRQELLQLVEDMTAPAGTAIYYVPHNQLPGTSTPADPGLWRPCIGSARLDSLYYPPQLMVEVPAGMIAADEPYRVFMNLAPLANEWKVTGQWVDPSGTPVESSDTQPAEWAASAAAPESARRRYGPVSKSLNAGTCLVAGVQGETPDSALARFWLARTGYPTWGADSVVIPFDAAACEVDRDRADHVWRRLLALGPGACGFRVGLQGVRGSSRTTSTEEYPEWVVEGMQIDWLEDGWEVTLTSLSDPAVYFGTATSDPVDPRSAVSLERPMPDVVPASGVLLRPLWFHGGVQGATGGYWRVAVAGTGQRGPFVANTGPGCLLPTGPLNIGPQRLVVQRLPHPESTQPTDWLEVDVTVAAGYRWADLPDIPWTQVPDTLTWAAAAAASDWLGG